MSPASGGSSTVSAINSTMGADSERGSSSSTDTEAPCHKYSQFEQLERDLHEFKLASKDLEAELESELEAAEAREAALISQLADLRATAETERSQYLHQIKEKELNEKRLVSKLEQQAALLTRAQTDLRAIEIENDDMARSSRAHAAVLEQYSAQNSNLLEQLALAETDRLDRIEENRVLAEQLQRAREELREAQDELQKLAVSEPRTDRKSLNHHYKRDHLCQSHRPLSGAEHQSQTCTNPPPSWGSQTDISISSVGSARSVRSAARRMATMITQVGVLEESVATVRRKLDRRRGRSRANSNASAANSIGEPPIRSAGSQHSTSRSVSLDASRALLNFTRMSRSPSPDALSARRSISPTRPRLNIALSRARSQPALPPATQAASPLGAVLAARHSEANTRPLPAAGHGRPLF